MKIVSVCNRRGGVAKTFTAGTLGAGLSDQGYKVLLIDLDSQINLSTDLGMAPEYDYLKIISGQTTLEEIERDNGRLSSMDILMGARVEDAIIKGQKWDIITGSPMLATANMKITGPGSEYRLKESLSSVSSQYDYIIIDTAPALDILTVNALTTSDGVIIPVQAEKHSLEGIALLNESIKQVRRYCNPSLSIYGILITRYNARTIISQDMRYNIELAAKLLNTKVYQNPIREYTVVKESQALENDLFTTAPRSKAAEDYRAFVNEFIEDMKGEK